MIPAPGRVTTQPVNHQVGIHSRRPVLIIIFHWGYYLLISWACVAPAGHSNCIGMDGAMGMTCLSQATHYPLANTTGKRTRDKWGVSTMRQEAGVGREPAKSLEDGHWHGHLTGPLDDCFVFRNEVEVENISYKMQGGETSVSCLLNLGL